MLRAAWITRDMLPTLGSDPGAVTLLPGTGGALEITSDGATIWERMRDGGLPDAKVLIERECDAAWPERDLGQSDRAPVEPRSVSGAAWPTFNRRTAKRKPRRSGVFATVRRRGPS